GFYNYVKGKKRDGVPQTASVAPAGEMEDPVIEERVVLRLMNEAAKVIAEGVAAEPWIVDLALVLGTGFAPQTGGPLSYAEQLGVPTLLHSLEDWERKCGSRFTPSAWWMDHLVSVTK